MNDKVRMGTYMVSNAEACWSVKAPSPITSNSWPYAPARALRIALGDSTPILVARSRIINTGADAVSLVSSRSSGGWFAGGRGGRDSMAIEGVSSSISMPNRLTIAVIACSRRPSLTMSVEDEDIHAVFHRPCICRIVRRGDFRSAMLGAIDKSWPSMNVSG